MTEQAVALARGRARLGVNVRNDADEQLLQQLDLEAEILADRVPVLVAIADADRWLDETRVAPRLM